MDRPRPHSSMGVARDGSRIGSGDGASTQQGHYALNATYTAYCPPRPGSSAGQRGASNRFFVAGITGRQWRADPSKSFEPPGGAAVAQGHNPDVCRRCGQNMLVFRRCSATGNLHAIPPVGAAAPRQAFLPEINNGAANNRRALAVGQTTPSLRQGSGPDNYLDEISPVTAQNASAATTPTATDQRPRLSSASGTHSVLVRAPGQASYNIPSVARAQSPERGPDQGDEAMTNARIACRAQPDTSITFAAMAAEDEKMRQQTLIQHEQECSRRNAVHQYGVETSFGTVGSLEYSRMLRRKCVIIDAELTPHEGVMRDRVEILYDEGLNKIRYTYENSAVAKYVRYVKELLAETEQDEQTLRLSISYKESVERTKLRGDRKFTVVHEEHYPSKPYKDSREGTADTTAAQSTAQHDAPRLEQPRDEDVITATTSSTNLTPQESPDRTALPESMSKPVNKDLQAFPNVHAASELYEPPKQHRAKPKSGKPFEFNVHPYHERELRLIQEEIYDCQMQEKDVRSDIILDWFVELKAVKQYFDERIARELDLRTQEGKANRREKEHEMSRADVFRHYQQLAARPQSTQTVALLKQRHALHLAQLELLNEQEEYERQRVEQEELEAFSIIFVGYREFDMLSYVEQLMAQMFIEQQTNRRAITKEEAESATLLQTVLQSMGPRKRAQDRTKELASGWYYEHVDYYYQLVIEEQYSRVKIGVDLRKAIASLFTMSYADIVLAQAEERKYIVEQEDAIYASILQQMKITSPQLLAELLGLTAKNEREYTREVFRRFRENCRNKRMERLAVIVTQMEGVTLGHLAARYISMWEYVMRSIKKQRRNRSLSEELRVKNEAALCTNEFNQLRGYAAEKVAERRRIAEERRRKGEVAHLLLSRNKTAHRSVTYHRWGKFVKYVTLQRCRRNRAATLEETTNRVLTRRYLTKFLRLPSKRRGAKCIAALATKNEKGLRYLRWRTWKRWLAMQQKEAETACVECATEAVDTIVERTLESVGREARRLAELDEAQQQQQEEEERKHQKEEEQRRRHEEEKKQQEEHAKPRRQSPGDTPPSRSEIGDEVAMEICANEMVGDVVEQMLTHAGDKEQQQQN